MEYRYKVTYRTGLKVTPNTSMPTEFSIIIKMDLAEIESNPTNAIQKYLLKTDNPDVALLSHADIIKIEIL